MTHVDHRRTKAKGRKLEMTYYSQRKPIETTTTSWWVSETGRIDRKTLDKENNRMRGK